MGSEVRLGSGSTKRRRGAESRSGRGPEGKAVGAGRRGLQRQQESVVAVRAEQ